VLGIARIHAHSQSDVLYEVAGRASQCRPCWHFGLVDSLLVRDCPVHPKPQEQHPSPK
jgi:hypothetical protein